jgi:hypothetical protein
MAGRLVRCSPNIGMAPNQLDISVTGVDTTTAQAAMLMALAAITRTRSHQLQQGAPSGQQDLLSIGARLVSTLSGKTFSNAFGMPPNWPLAEMAN